MSSHKKAAAFFANGAAVTARYELIRREEGNYPVAWMCRWARVSKSGYYGLAEQARVRHRHQAPGAGRAY